MMSESTIQEIFCCTHCDRSYTEYSTLLQHQRLHSIDESESLESLQGRQRSALHGLAHSDPKCRDKGHYCPILNEWTVTNVSATSEIHTCTICYRSFRYAWYLEYHKKSHIRVKPYKCQICEKAFVKKSSCKEHEKLHSGIKPFKCPHCDMWFASEYYCNGHITNKHKQRNWHKCSYCDKCFAGPSKRDQHERSHTGEKPYKCPQCEKWFARLKNVKEHQLLHAGVKPFNCPHCDKKFRTSTLLKGHTVHHTGVKPYTCPHCDKTFSSSVIQQRHIQIHTGEKCHKCFSCNESFRTISLLRKHEIKHGGTKCHESVLMQQGIQLVVHPKLSPQRSGHTWFILKQGSSTGYYKTLKKKGPWEEL